MLQHDKIELETRCGPLILYAASHVSLVLSVISAKVVNVLAISARMPGSNPTVDGYLSTSFLKAL